MRAWARRAAELHGELAAIAEADPRWWILAGGAAAAEPFPPRETYVISDAEPGADTFIGYRTPRPADPYVDAVARARAARQALRELDGLLPEQPLAVTVNRGGDAVIEPSLLDVAAFAIGDRVIVGRLDDDRIVEKLKIEVLARGEVVPGTSRDPKRADAASRDALRRDSIVRLDSISPQIVPFVCVSIGDEPLATARHGHRRAWTERGGPWLGLGRASELATVSTCHFVVDGYGHARIAGRIAELVATETNGAGPTLPPLAPVHGAIALGVAWRELPQPVPRAIPMAYALGRVLHRRAGRRDSPFSPTFQIPVAPGRRDDPMRWYRRVVPAITSVRFDNGVPEPFEAFESRVREALAREADGRGLCSRLLAAARAAPAPLAWKRKSVSATRPRWLDRFADVIGGRACLSRIHVDAPLPSATCAVSSPARLATPEDPLGGCVITVLDDGTHAAITACGSGKLAGDPADANALLDELLALL